MSFGSEARGRICPRCGAAGVAHGRGLRGVEVLICIVLTIFGLIPGIVYYVVVESRPSCAGCGRRV